MALTRQEVIEIAKREVKDLFREDHPVHVGLEEFRRGRGGVWLITIGFRTAGSFAAAEMEAERQRAEGISRDPAGRLFRVVEIDPEDGEVLSVTDRFNEAA